jgi:aspartate aminotransferase-like enzyme
MDGASFTLASCVEDAPEEKSPVYRPQNLRIPGPTFVPQTVLAASARPMINHRGPEFAALLAALTRALQDFLRTQGDVLLLTASGSGGMEAAVANTLSSGDKVVLFVNGAFGERFYAICKAYGVDARRVDVPLGRAVDPELVREELSKEKGKDAAKAVLVTHNETSTGVLNPMKEIAEVVRESGKLLIVDSVSGAGAVELEIDEWGIDVCITASQKAWGAPPGLAIVTMSEKAWKFYERSSLPKAYFDLMTYKIALEKGATPATPAVSVVIALQESLRLMAEEGLEAILRRHRDLARATRRGLQAVNLSLFADEAHASPAVTAFRPPTRVDARNLIRVLRDDYDTILAGGQGKLDGQLVRVGHMGFVTMTDMVAFFSALELALRDFNQPVESGQAIAAALRSYAESSAQPARAGARVAPRADTVGSRR